MQFLKKIHPLIWLGALMTMLFSPTLFFGAVQRRGFDIVLDYYPFMLSFWRDGHFWSKYILSGHPISLTTVFGGTWILFLPLAKILSPLPALFLVVLLMLFLTAFFVYLLCRELGLGKIGSAVAASVYIFSEHLFTEAYRSQTVAPSLIIFPALSYIFLKLKNKFSWLYILLGGFILALGLAFGQPQWALMALIAVAFLCFYWLFFEKWEDKKQLKKFLLSGVLIILMGLSLSWWQTSPFLALEKNTYRATGEFPFNPAAGLGPVEFVSFIFPFFDDALTGNYSIYLGILPLVLALYAIFKAGREKHFKPFFWLLVFGLLFVVKYSPIVWLVRKMPLLKASGNWTRFLDIILVVFAYFAAVGFEMLWERRHEIRLFWFYKYLRRLLMAFVSGTVLINIIGLFKNSIISFGIRYFDSHVYNETKLLPLDYYHKAIETLVNSKFWIVSFANPGFLIAFFVFVLGVLAILYLNKLNRGVFATVIILSGFIMAFNLLGDIIPLKVIAKNYEAAEFLKNQEGIFRIYSLTPQTVEYRLLSMPHGAELNFEDRVEFFRGIIAVNSNIIDGLDSIDGFESFIRKRNHDILGKLLSERTVEAGKILGKSATLEDKYTIITDRLNLLSMMNVRYLVSAYRLGDPKLQLVFETTATRFKIPIYVYENPSVLPRFYFAAKPRFMPPDSVNEILETLLTSGFDFKKETIIECWQCENGVGNGRDDFEVIEYKSGYLAVKTHASNPGWLVFSEDKREGWRAFLDNKETPIYPSNYLYQAVLVPAGDHLLEFKFGWNLMNWPF